MSSFRYCRPSQNDLRRETEVPRRLESLDGADERTRTVDLLITNQLLYQLSYIGLSSARL